MEIYEVTQKCIQRSILAYVKNKDWGDPKKYDLTVDKDGEGKGTSYNVIASPSKPLDKEIEQAYKDTPINLEALFSGEDPFTTEQVKDAQATFKSE